MLEALFTAPTTPPPNPGERAKRQHSRHTTEGVEEHARNKERTNLEVVRRASFSDFFLTFCTQKESVK